MNWLVDFSASWCANCKELARISRENADFNKALSKAVLLKVSESTALFETYEKDSRFPELKIGLPFFGSSGFRCKTSQSGYPVNLSF
jgi:thiol:disulfide interchange protein DsbD